MAVNEAPDSEVDGPNPLHIPDEQTLDELLHHFATRDAPRIFALCEVSDGWRGARVAAWGLALPGQAVVFLLEEHTFGIFSDAQRAADMLGIGRHLRLVWPDPMGRRDLVTS